MGGSRAGAGEGPGRSPALSQPVVLCLVCTVLLSTGLACAGPVPFDVRAPAGAGRTVPLRLSARVGGGPYVPLADSTAPAGPLALRATVEGLRGGLRVAVFRLERLPSDTTLPRPPFWLSPPTGALEVRGVDLASPLDTLGSVEQPVLSDTSAVVEAEWTGVGEGVYRVAFEARATPADAPFAAATRLLVVRPRGFPEPATIEDLLDPLAYVAPPQDLAVIRAGATPEERQRRFDVWWGGLARSQARGEAAARTFYARVEAANRRFSGWKAGWKTDRGMTHVVFGPPVWVERGRGVETWHYRPSDAPAFTFERTGAAEGAPPFETWTLRRSAAYEEAWREALRRWRAGEVP